MRARGIDPGATIGWCDIERESAGVFRYIASGTWEAADVGRGLRLPLDDIDVFSIETPEEMHANDIRAGVAHGFGTVVQTIRNLLETRALAERIACSLVGAGVRIVEPTAAECRRALGVKLGAQRGRGPKLTVDQQIAQIIPLAVRGWPARSNPHVRDAAAAAIWALGAAEVESAIALALRRDRACKACDGTGHDQQRYRLGSGLVDCPKCHGHGVLADP